MNLDPEEILGRLRNGVERMAKDGFAGGDIYIHPTHKHLLGGLHEFMGWSLVYPSLDSLSPIAAFSRMAPEDVRFWNPENCYLVPRKEATDGTPEP